MSGAESRLRVIRVDSAVSEYVRLYSERGGRADIARGHFRKWEAIPFLTHEHMLYRLEQLLQAGHAEVSMCKMGSFGAIGRHCILNTARF